MKVFVAGATGALGRQLIRQLGANGHEVTGMTRTEAKRDLIAGLGARPAVADALDPEAVGEAVGQAEPEAVIHQLTALSGEVSSIRNVDRAFASTNRLRREGTDHLLSAARAVGSRRFVAQSFGGWPYAREGGPVKTEEDALDPDPPKTIRETLAAIRYLEGAVVGVEPIEGIALRYGGFYGPGTSLGLNPVGEQVEAVQKRRFPIVGSGDGILSFIHIEDAATATVAALESGRPGVYNIVDDEPAPAREWLPVLAEAVGAKPPRRVPLWVGRFMAGEALTTMMTEARGGSNEKAKRELGWWPRYANWREGFATGLG
jgi:nucleoside-diphosphate-sugar epimerase